MSLTSFDFNLFNKWSTVNVSSSRFFESHSLRFDFARSLEMVSSDSASSSGGMTMGFSKSKVLSKKPELMNLIFMKHLHAKNYAYFSYQKFNVMIKGRFQWTYLMLDPSYFKAFYV